MNCRLTGQGACGDSLVDEPSGVGLGPLHLKQMDLRGCFAVHPGQHGQFHLGFRTGWIDDDFDIACFDSKLLEAHSSGSNVFGDLVFSLHRTALAGSRKAEVGVRREKLGGCSGFVKALQGSFGREEIQRLGESDELISDASFVVGAQLPQREAGRKDEEGPNRLFQNKTLPTILETSVVPKSWSIMRMLRLSPTTKYSFSLSSRSRPFHEGFGFV